MRITARLLAVSLVCVAAACGGGPAAAPGKLVVLGFDGMDPALVSRWMDEGKLPHLRALAERGAFRRLETTVSADTPTAWASFATGVNPGKHNVFDTFVRDPHTYRLALGLIRRVTPRVIFHYIPIRRASVRSTRAGTSFWVTAGRAGIRSSVITVPVTYPPENVPNGELLAGLPLPDLRGTMGTYSYFGTDVAHGEEGQTESGGVATRLVFDSDVARTSLLGPTDPTSPASAPAPLRLPLVIHWNREGRSATLEIGDAVVHLQEGEWSKWIDVTFSANFLIQYHGMTQFFLVGAGDDLRLYVSPVNWKPDQAPAQMSAPASLAGDLYERLGHYRTLGWAATSWPLNEGRIDERAFMEDLNRAFDDRTEVLLQRLDTGRWDLLVGVIESTDRVQHMMWRLTDPTHPMYDATLAAAFGDAIERVYKRCDDFVGDVVSRLDPSTPILIVSTHGFHSFRQAVNLNTWLVEQGYMTLRDAQAPVPALNDVFDTQATFWNNVDWSATRAYAFGFGQIFLNRADREGEGIVRPEEADGLETEIADRLRQLRDPDTGGPVVASVERSADVYHGPFVANAPDLQVGFADGYRVSWETALGAAPPGVIVPNLQKWSGDHASFDAAATPGTLISSRPIETEHPRVIDIAATVLQYFGVPLPDDLDGRPLF